MNSENNSRGIILVIVAMALFSIQDALIKFVFEQAALYEIYFGRIFIASVILGLYILVTKQKLKIKTEYPFLTLIRVLLHFFAFSFFFISLTFMSLAMANALFFSSPFFISIFLELFHLIIPNRGFEFSDLFGNIMGVSIIYLYYQISKIFTKK